MGKLAYILGARENMAVIQIQATPPLHPQALSDSVIEQDFLSSNNN